MYQILPYIEQQALYNLRRGDGGTNAGFVKTGLAQKPVSVFNCPDRTGRFAVNGITVYLAGDYAGVMANWNDPGWEGFAWQTSKGPVTDEDTLVWTGILAKGGQVNKSSTPPQIWKFPRVDFKSIEDGSSNTILVAEKAVAQENWSAPLQPFAYWEIYGYYTGADWPIMRMFAALKPVGDNRREIPVMGDADSAHQQRSR